MEKKMEGDCQVNLFVAADAESSKPEGSGMKRGSKIAAALLSFTLLLALAAAAAFLVFNGHAEVRKDNMVAKFEACHSGVRV